MAEDIIGTTLDDFLDGTADAESIKGLAGDDTLNGGLGNDTLKGGSRDDKLHGDEGDDLLIGAKGADTLDGGEGSDTCRVVVKDAGFVDTFADTGVSGTDTIDATRVTELQLTDTFDSSSGMEVIEGDLNAGLILFGGSSPVLWDFALIALSGVDQIKGSGSDDIITGSGGDDRIKGLDGDDLLYGNGGDDTLIGGGGNDTLHGDAGDDVLKGGSATDTLDGGAGNDRLLGGGEDDVLIYDSADTDEVNGGDGEDTLLLAGSGASLDLSEASGTILLGLEVIELSGTGANTLLLDKASIRNLSDTSNTLRALGDADDVVVTVSGEWTEAGTTVIDSLTFDVYTNGAVTLQVQQGINQTQINTPINDAPGAGDDSATTSESATVILPSVLSNDVDPDDEVLIISGFDNNSTGGVPISFGGSGSITYNPAGFFEYLSVGEATSDTFTYTVSDGQGGSDTGTVTVTITGENDPVSADDDAASVSEDGTTGNLVSTVLSGDTDPDTSDVLRVTDVGTAGKGTVTFSAGTGLPGDETLTYAADGGVVDALAVGETTTDTFTYTVGDGQGGSDTGTVTVTITGVNDPVSADDDVASVNEDGNTADLISTLLAGDTDADTSDVLRVTGATQGSKGTVTFNAGTAAPGDESLTYTADGNVLDALAVGETTTDTFTYTVGDGQGSSDTATVTVTITGVNDAPVITSNGGDTPTGINVAENSTAVTTVVATDVDAGATVTYSISGGADASLFSIDSGTGVLSFLAAPDFESPADAGTNNLYEVAVAATDGTLTDTQALNISVTNVNDVAPVIAVDGTVGYSVGAAGVTLDGTIMLSDADSTALAGASISIGSFQSGDVLHFSNQSGITGSFDGGTGVLTLSGSATLAQYETALESITFSTSSLVQVDRSISFSVNDGVTTGAEDTVTVDIAAEVNLSILNGTNGLQLIGGAASDYSGFFVSDAGDVNGDGFDDLIIGAHRAGPNGNSESGASYVVFGAASGFASEINLATLGGSDGFQINGEAASDYSGFSVSRAGDVNGDGFDDLIIGAFGADPNGNSESGASYVVFGAATAFASELNLSTLDGSNGFQINGEAADDFSGRSVSAAGDVNGDGIDDLIVGATHADPNGNYSSGASYVVFGAASGFASELNLSTLDGSNGFQINGELAGDYSGRSSQAGDVNGDGFDDLIIGAFRADPNGDYSGASYVVFGAASGFASGLNLSTLDGSNGFQINGEMAGDAFGFSATSAGDVNGDGLDDLIIGANQADPNFNSRSGASYVVFGATSGFASELNLSTLDGSNGFQINGEGANDRSGFSVSQAGDVNGDGFDDLLIGARFAEPNGSYSGASYVVFGAATGFVSELNLSTLDGSNGFQINGEAASDYSGFSVSQAGDVNGDGFDDLMIGAHGADPSGSYSGASYVLFGADFRDEVDFRGGSGNDTQTGTVADEILIGGLGNDTQNGGGGADVLQGGAGDDVLIIDSSDTHVDGGNGVDTAMLSGGGMTLDLADVPGNVLHNIEFINLTGTGNNTLSLDALSLLYLSDTSNTLRVTGNAGDAVDTSGSWVALTDTVIGAVTYQQWQIGEALLQVQAGVDTSGITVAPAAIDLAGLNGSNGFRLDGTDAGDRSGWSVSDAGDVNGDGFDDLIIGAFGGDANGDSYAGESYVVFGKASGFASFLDLAALDGANGFRLDGIDVSDYSGVSVASAGDVNGDGFDDLIIGAERADPNGDNFAGESYVVFGKAGGFASFLDLAALDGANGFRLDGIDAYDLSGRSVASAGDVNGDGFDDLIIGALFADPNANPLAGESYVVFGKAGGFASFLDLAMLDGTDGFQLVGIDASDHSGVSVASAGDVNGDGFDDMIIGADRADPNGDTYAGESYLVFGNGDGFASVLDLSALDGANGFRLDGILPNDRSGFSVAAAGDVNGDGFGDLIIGADHADPIGVDLAGESYVVFGKASGFASFLDLAALDGTNGFRLDGIDAGDLSGHWVESAGDVNGDGFDDLIIAAFLADPNGDAFAGESYVVFGKVSGFASFLDLSALDGTNGFRLDGIDASDYSGISVSAAGDVNGDGFDDLIIGADRADPNGDADAGESYVIFGGDFRDEVDFIGGSGNDAFTGGSGDDIVMGGLGDDTLIGGGGTDVLQGGVGIDTLNGDAGVDRLEGGAGNDLLNGGDHNDRLLGEEGADTLDGGLGSDVLIGEGDNDVFLFNDALGATNVDTIMDFGGAGSTALDIIHLDNAIFTALSDGVPAGTAFESGAGLSAAATANGRIIYDITSGALYYDADGVGGAAAVQFAVIATDVNGLSAEDFLVI